MSLYVCIQAVLKRVHPPRPDWYEEFYASVLNTSMKAYEAEVGRGFCAFTFGTNLLSLTLDKSKPIILFISLYNLLIHKLIFGFKVSSNFLS